MYSVNFRVHQPLTAEFLVSVLRAPVCVPIHRSASLQLYAAAAEQGSVTLEHNCDPTNNKIQNSVKGQLYNIKP